MNNRKAPPALPPYRSSLAGTLLAARESAVAPIRPVLRDRNVTEQQWRVLRVLADRRPMDAQGISDAALLHGPSITRILKELTSRGLVERYEDPHDRRRTSVALTRKGRQLVSHVTEHLVTLNNRYAELFGAERLDALKKELNALSTTIDGMEKLEY